MSMCVWLAGYTHHRQFLTAERKITSREIQVMLEKNDAALGGWNALHTQERTSIQLYYR